MDVSVCRTSWTGELAVLPLFNASRRTEGWSGGQARHSGLAVEIVTGGCRQVLGGYFGFFRGGRSGQMPVGLSRAPLALRSLAGRQQSPLTIPNARGRGRGLAALECSPGAGPAGPPVPAPKPPPLPRFSVPSGEAEDQRGLQPTPSRMPWRRSRGFPHLPRPGRDLCSRVIPLPRERPGRRFPRSLARGLVKLQQHKCWRTWTNN